MDDFDKVFAKALRFLSYRQRSEKEVRDHLLKKPLRPRHSGKRSVSRNLPEDSGVVSLHETPQNDTVERVIEALKEKKFLNDKEFARMWVESRMRSKPRALHVIKSELKQKGISQDIVEMVLNNENTKTMSEKDMALQIIEKKLRLLKNVPEEEIRNKLGQLLARKGFNWDTIKEVLSHLENRS